MLGERRQAGRIRLRLRVDRQEVVVAAKNAAMRSSFSALRTEQVI